MKNLKNIFILLIAFVASYFVVDNWLYLFLDSCYMKSNDKIAKAATNNKSYDVVVLGSSRAEYHYDPKIINQVSGLSCYNYGASGMNIFYDYALLNVILKKSKPKVCLLEVFYKDIVCAEDSWETGCLSALYPYYSKNDVVDDVIALKGKEELFLINLSKTYRFNTTILSYLKNLALGVKPDNNGYEPVEGVLRDEVKPLEFNCVYNNTKIQYLKDFVKFCKANGIKCVFCVSPMFFDNEPTKLELYKPMFDIAKEENIDIWDYCSDIRFLSSNEYFRDYHHLSNLGVSEYSKSIRENLLELVKEHY